MTSASHTTSGAAQWLWTPQAWLAGVWHDNVLLGIDAQGLWCAIETGVTPLPAAAQVLEGALLPGMVNAHSHAFQRVFAGLTEWRRGDAQDNFWSWRDRMYQVALSISPDQLEAIAAQLYTEMLQGGYTHVCEFHYLHHAPNGQSYGDPLEMTWALVRAAQTAGIGLTVLPVLYQRAGFAQSDLRDDQRRFATTPDTVWQMQQSIANAHLPNINSGVAIHSLRAATMPAIQALTAHVGDAALPIHIHIAEQTAEVDECLAVTGMRPLSYLTQHIRLDPRWHLVHATHASSTEIDAVATSGAGLVMCPTTEANLGDGLTDMPRWLEKGVPLTLGSDSHVSRQWREELRWLEYGQRLRLRQRNVLATQAASSGDRLFQTCIQAGAAAAGLVNPASASTHLGGLQIGARADALVLDGQAPAWLGVAKERLLDALIFASDGAGITHVMVAGQWRILDGQHASQTQTASLFVQARRELTADR